MIELTDRPEAHRYELTVDGELTGFVAYRRDEGTIALLHADIDPRREGEGLGSEMVRRTLDDARAQGLRVRPVCSFVASFIERNAAAYGDLVSA